MKKVISMHIYESTSVGRELNNMLKRLRHELIFLDGYCVDDNCFKFEIGEEVFHKLLSITNAWYDTDMRPGGIIFGVPFEVQSDLTFLTNRVDLIYDDRPMRLKSVLNHTYGIKSVKEKVEIKKVIFNNPCTIIFWSDGDKTIVKCNSEDFDKEKGLAMAIAKKFLGTNKSKSNYNDIFKKWIKDRE